MSSFRSSESILMCIHYPRAHTILICCGPWLLWCDDWLNIWPLQNSGDGIILLCSCITVDFSPRPRPTTNPSVTGPPFRSMTPAPLNVSHRGGGPHRRGVCVAGVQPSKALFAAIVEPIEGLLPREGSMILFMYVPIDLSIVAGSFVGRA